MLTKRPLLLDHVNNADHVQSFSITPVAKLPIDSTCENSDAVILANSLGAADIRISYEQRDNL